MREVWERVFGWYEQVWPNVASNFLSLPFALAWQHRRIVRKLRRQTVDIVAQVVDQIRGKDE